ncbi:hypothetical protein [Streptomyces sp. YKOK-I1]
MRSLSDEHSKADQDGPTVGGPGPGVPAHPDGERGRPAEHEQGGGLEGQAAGCVEGAWTGDVDEERDSKRTDRGAVDSSWLPSRSIQRSNSVISVELSAFMMKPPTPLGDQS